MGITLEMNQRSQESRSSAEAWPDGNQNSSSTIRSVNKEEGNFWYQYKALLIRNFTIKIRDRRKTVVEFFLPLYWIAILAIVRLAVGGTSFDPVLTPHGSASLTNSIQYTLNGTTLHVAPDNNKIKTVMESVRQMARTASAFLELKFYDTESELINEFRQNMSMSTAVVFPNDLVDSNYTLRLNPVQRILPSPDSFFSGNEECRARNPETGLQFGGCSPNFYYFSGFSALQLLIDTAITRNITGISDILIPNVILENFPRAGFISNGTTTLRSIIPLYMVFAWAQFVIYMMMLVVEEKEKKIKVAMKMMGLRDSVYWLSWFSVYAMYVLVLALICIIVLPLARVFVHANLFLLFMLFVLYGSSSIVLALMLTPFFNKAKVAGIVGNLLQVAMSLLYYLQVYLEGDMDQGAFWALGLLSPCAFAMAIDKVILFDSANTGLSFSNVWEGPGLPFAGSLIMISIDILIYLFLAFYLDNVLPSEYGTKRKPWFIFEKSFWFPHNKYYKINDLTSNENSGFEDDGVPPNPDVEPIVDELKGKVAVRIRNLKKTFKSKEKDPIHAVDGISLDVYEGQITAILGHNGAGKTTLFNMLTGMTAPTSGTASIFGLNINDANDLEDIRRVTGVCPQHDIIFVNLTPREHLSFYARIRGIPSDKVEATVEQTLQEVDLSSKGDCKAGELSGGQKRKLSIGIALIGDPKLVFLDEPTAGVDAYSRRKLWSLLKNRKEGKVILLTTHFMDEADILSDRKAIVSKGKLRCCGSSLFLKNKFGLGYHLTLIVPEDCDIESVNSVVQSAVDDAQLARHFGKEVSFLLPANSTESFSKLFSSLDEQMSGEGTLSNIEGYGISMTTLEEVFLTLSEENEASNHQTLEDMSKMIRDKLSSSSPIHSASTDYSESQNNEQTVNDTTQGFPLDTVEVCPNAWRTYKAMVKIRAIGLLREKAALFFLVIFPLIFTIGAIALLDTQKFELPVGRELHLSTDVYKGILPGALINNKTDHALTDLGETLHSAGIITSSYSGNYTSIYELSPHFAALDVQSFPEKSDSLDPTAMRVRFNDTYMHSIPMLVNLVSNAILSAYGSNNSIGVSTHNLPTFSNMPKFDVSTFFAPMLIGFVYTLIPAGLGIEIVNDREIGARNLLRLNGLGFNLYFSSFITVMIIVFLIPYIALIIIIAAFNVESLIIPPALGALSLLYLLYMPVSFLYAATFGYIFDKMETARQFYPNIATTIGFLSYSIVSIIDMTLQDGNTALIIHIAFTILLPHYIPFGLLYYINKIYLPCAITRTCDQLTISDYMTTEIVVLFVVVLIDVPLYYVLLRLADTLKMGGNWRDALWMSRKGVVEYTTLQETGIDAPPGEDEDVIQERADVAAYLSSGGPPPPVILHDLGKIYNKGAKGKEVCGRKKKDKEFVAVKSVSLAVKESQVFGLLGPNGAGKTTTLRVLTAEEGPTKGRVQICGNDIQSALGDVFQKLGYCAQHDVLWKNITVAEHIACYAEIRGIHPSYVQQLVDMYLKGLEIEEHRDKQSKDCSGGTKRKLSYIISMLGKPQVVLMDEPSTGMDPQSKRFLWNSILASFKGNRSAILTTHSMEEADALCSRIAIQVRGGLRCIGSVQHLKNKYGGGYTLEVKLQKRHYSSADRASPSNALNGTVLENVKQRVGKIFPNAVLDEEFGELLQYKIPQSDIKSLATSFAMLEQAKNDELISEYALSQTTLEQVFLQFARQQEDADENDD